MTQSATPVTASARNTPMRVVWLLGFYLGTVFVPIIIGDTLWPSTTPEREGWHIDTVTLAALPLQMLAVAWFAPRVAFRRVDALWVLVPVVGTIVTVRILWRHSLLPLRDWPPRDDEWHRVVPIDARHYALRDRTAEAQAGAPPGSVATAPSGSRVRARSNVTWED